MFVVCDNQIRLRPETSQRERQVWIGQGLGGTRSRYEHGEDEVTLNDKSVGMVRFQAVGCAWDSEHGFFNQGILVRVKNKPLKCRHDFLSDQVTVA